MTKEQWIRHMEEVSGKLRPSNENGCMASEWKQAYTDHHYTNPDCPDCKARRKTNRARHSRQGREEAYKSAGLVKVYGAVSGRVYWE
jgi:hypothetical protein